MLKMNAPMNVDSAFWETSSATTIVNARGVAVLLAEAYAATIDATANVAITSMLDDMMDSSDSIDSGVMVGTCSPRPVPSTAWERNAATTDSNAHRQWSNPELFGDAVEHEPNAACHRDSGHVEWNGTSDDSTQSIPTEVREPENRCQRRYMPIPPQECLPAPDGLTRSS